MTFWIVTLLLIALVIAFVLWPLIVGSTGPERLEQAVAFYEARKNELVRQHENGDITEDEMNAALAEQARALLALSRTQKARGADELLHSVRRRKMATLLMLLGIPALSTAIYLRIGAPNLPDAPLASRQTAPQNFDVATALQKIEAHLAKNPDDVRGYEVVAPVYLKAGRFSDAANAYRRVVILSGETPERLSDLAESLVAMGNGVISAEARQAFERAVKLDPDFAKPRFYLALAREQDGDVAGALADLRKIASDLPEGPARMRVNAEIERFEAESKTAPAVPRGSATEAIAGLPQQEREDAIKGMVDALDTRLTAGGGTIEEWRRLIQSRLVMNQRELARAALDKARTAFVGNAAALVELDAMAELLRTLPEAKTP